MSTGQGHASFTQPVVLCIDDDHDVLGVLRDFLTTFGYRIVTASDPEEICKLLLNTRIDAVITDYHMRQVTSEELVLSLRTLRPNIPIVIFSGTDSLPETLLSRADAAVRKTEISMLLPELARLLKDRSE
jgi:DNA-binding NtrC family response regulator